MLVEPHLPPNDHNFTGRNRERGMTVKYATSESTRIVSIYGAPTFGKSQVAIAVGHDLKSQGKQVYHIDLHDVYVKDDLISAFLRFCSNQSVGHFRRVLDFLLHQFRKD